MKRGGRGARCDTEGLGLFQVGWSGKASPRRCHWGPTPRTGDTLTPPSAGTQCGFPAPDHPWATLIFLLGFSFLNKTHCFLDSSPTGHWLRSPGQGVFLSGPSSSLFQCPWRSMAHHRWEVEWKSSRLCRDPRNQCSHISVIISLGGLCRVATPGGPCLFLLQCQSWPRGRCLGRGWSQGLSPATSVAGGPQWDIPPSISRHKPHDFIGGSVGRT